MELTLSCKNTNLSNKNTVIVIYTPKVTNRIQYIMDFVFHNYFGIPYELTENPDADRVPENFYICYAAEKKVNYFTIFQDDLLLEEEIKEQKIFVSRESDLPVFYQTSADYDIKFDIFSCAFYLLSRYEEYLPHEKDEHGRYASSNSILSKTAFQFSPIVEFWLKFLKQHLVKQVHESAFKIWQFEYLPTFDIDHAFQYTGRNWLKHPPNIFETDCWKSLSDYRKDKYAIYDSLFKEMDEQELNPVFFFLMNDDGINNSNVSPHSKSYQKLIADISKKYTCGLHPSYHALQEDLFEKEYNTLARYSGVSINFSRQHFLRVSFPAYYRALAQQQITKDFSLAYPDVSGFRAGYSRSFFFYDLETEKQSSLLLQPGSWMDATYAYYRHENEEEIFKIFLTIFNQLKEINGILVPIFHNDLLANQKYWGIFRFINQQVNR